MSSEKTKEPRRKPTTPRPLPEPSPAELALLKPLWRDGRMSARELHDRAGTAAGWAYSTTRTTLDRMVKKGLLRRAVFHGLLLYEPAASRPATLAGLIRDFAERVLEVEAGAVVSLFAGGERLTGEELAELKRLVEGHGGERRR